jgi:fucose permease
LEGKLRAIHGEEITYQLFIFCRFIGVLILNYVDPALLLSFYGVACCVFSLAVALATGKAGIGCLFALFFFESICYPACFFTIFNREKSDASTFSVFLLWVPKI